MNSVTNNRKVTFAIIIIIIGVVLLLDNLRIFDLYLPYYLFRWYMVFIILGIFLIVMRERPGPGITFILIGALFMCSDVYDISILRLWPALLIVAGVAILLRKNSFYKVPHLDETSTDVIDEFSVFSGANRVVNSNAFKGGRLTTVFGGAEIDLRNASLAEGTNVIDVFSMFGGSTITVPPHWKVVVKVTPIFGGYSDERAKNTGKYEEGSELVITGTVIFGGGELKSR